jgi:hypothetical protein
MVTEHFEFAGWTDNLRLANDQVEVVILREAGPRIISLRPLNGFNVFKVVAEESESRKRRPGRFGVAIGFGRPRKITVTRTALPMSSITSRSNTKSKGSSTRR